MAFAQHQPMLHEFLSANRQELINRRRNKVANRFAPSEVPLPSVNGAPLLLQQNADTLRAEQSTGDRVAAVSAPAPVPTAIDQGAALHGAELSRLGYSVDQVVHDYGDVCQAVTELAVEHKAPISNDEFRTLKRQRASRSRVFRMPID